MLVFLLNTFAQFLDLPAQHDHGNRTLVFLGFFLMMLLTLAQCNFRMVGIGFGLFALDYLWSRVISAISLLLETADLVI